MVEWVITPPYASHHGGAWERRITPPYASHLGGGRGRGGLGAIRTIRLVILCALLRPGHRLSHDGLCRPTLFCEVECIINGRPITKVSDDVNDDVPRTPNYLLMIKKCPSLPRWVGGGAIVLADVDQRQWKHVQFVVSQFWRRWMKEYLLGL